MEHSRMMDCGKQNEEGKLSDLVTRKLFEQRVVSYAEPVTRNSATRVISQLLCLSGEDAEAPIRLFLNSPGGDVDAGFAIFDVIKFIKAPVHIICTGLTASAGVLILLASPGEIRCSLPHTRIMIHQPSSGAHGDASDIEIEAAEILKCREQINKIVSDETGQPLEKVAADVSRNFWMSAQEAKDYGLISRIVENREELGI